MFSTNGEENKFSKGLNYIDGNTKNYLIIEKILFFHLLDILMSNLR